MATDVLMPQMGESIAEGTVSRWIKKVGEKVERDEPLLEISTDKVDAEIPSPAAGTLTEILVQEGQTVAVNSVVARISVEGEASAPAKPAQQPAPKPAAEAAAAPQKPAPPPAPAPQQQKAANEAMKQEVKQEAPAAAAPSKPATPPTDNNLTSLDERRRTKS